MKLTAITKYEFEKTIRGKFYGVTKLQSIIEAFAESGDTIAEITWTEGEYASAYSAQSAIKVALKRNNKVGVYDVITRKGRVFIINKLLYERENG